MTQDYFSFLKSIFEIKEIQLFFIVISIGILVYLLFLIGKMIFRLFSRLGEREKPKAKMKEKEISALDALDRKTKAFQEGKEIPEEEYLEEGDEGEKGENEAGSKREVIIKKTDNVSISKKVVDVEDKALLVIKFDYALLERIIFIAIILIEAAIIIWGFFR